jgi:ribosomal-protein-alanine N-acetyltransferase
MSNRFTYARPRPPESWKNAWLRKNAKDSIRMKWIRLRRATSEDIEEIYGLEESCFPTPWAKADMLKDLRENLLSTYMIAETAGEVIGYAALWTVLDEGHVLNVAMRPDMRGQGIATMMLSSLLEAGREKGAKSFTLEVRPSNESAIALYEKFGFKTVGVRKEYYADNKEDALIMWLFED